ncbi:MAG: homoserine O-acetyltransferase [Candidatus Eremiobacteraeota bacterium]|nr:homoserine O-acetyltransferase [Candidatus Eremiobacteraeota bacterium]
MMNRRAFLRLCALSAALLSAAGSEPASANPLVEKQVFSLDNFQFQSQSRALPVKIGYETYGTLNSARDNAILVCHYFSGTSHAAGKYRAGDPAPGWWDSVIGPGKAIDTDKYFVVSSDVLCNLNFHNPDVTTTGPASIDPQTGREYALDFPLLTLRDIVSVQRELISSLGIEKLALVCGPSLGGIQSFAWARYFPEMVSRICPVVSLPVIRPMMMMNPGQLAIDAIQLDPNWKDGNYYGGAPPTEGLLLAFKILLMSAQSDPLLESRYGRRPADPLRLPQDFFDGEFLVDRATEELVRGRLNTYDANSYIYLSKAVTLFDLREPGQSVEEALGEIKVPTLMINDRSDLMFGPEASEEMASQLGNAELFLYDSGVGHLSCLTQTQLFSNKISEFLDGAL